MGAGRRKGPASHCHNRLGHLAASRDCVTPSLSRSPCRGDHQTRDLSPLSDRGLGGSGLEAAELMNSEQRQTPRSHGHSSRRMRPGCLVVRLNGRARPAVGQPSSAAPKRPPIPPTGFTVEAAPPGDLGAALGARTVLHWLPDDGWQLGSVACLCPRGAFSRVVAYIGPSTGRRRRCAARRTRSSTPPPMAPAVRFSQTRRPRRRVWPGPFEPAPPDPKFEFGWWLFTAPG